MEPASTIVKLLGGPSKVARLVGVHRTRVSSWKRSKDRGGTGGRIPQSHHEALLAAAAEQGIALAAEDFIGSRPGAEDARQSPAADRTTPGSREAAE
ncbi:carph-isopro domain-containing protein [Methylocystis iwaonis]|uniref:carph-isopro domain-containing protein n=1 Tax=Methylocystis iwaonis TaxID=2885079 RepID=UPI0039B3BBEB